MPQGVLQDSQTFGRLITAAMGYAQMQRPAFAAAIGTSVPTFRRWEVGDFSSSYRTLEQRRQLAERVVTASGCPPEWFGLESAGSAGILTARVESLERQLQDVALLALGSDDEDVRAAVQAAVDAERQYDSTSSRPEERGSAEASG